MFDSLSERFERVFKTIRGHGRITETNITQALREVRLALLDADVNYNVVKEFLKQVKTKATGQEVMTSLTPGQQVIKIVHDELVTMMGERIVSLDLSVQPPAVIMMAGLQGSGKTTTTGKLAKRLWEREKKKCLVASLDVYRPAAMDQLATVAAQAGVDAFPGNPQDKPEKIAKEALTAARKGGYDVLILDTAGRLHIDEPMMLELQAVKKIAEPTEILLVADAMTGQDAVNVAKTFHERLTLTGVVLSKIDGDARGGAALSIRQVTGAPIKFMGTGEKLDGLEPFHPDRIASRILGMGDVLSLVESAMEKVDLQKAEKLTQRVVKGEFSLEDFLEQLEQIKKMGSIGDMMKMLPGMDQALRGRDTTQDDKQLRRVEAVIRSMTRQERNKHTLINASRRRRIAAGSGTSVQEVNKVLKQFAQTQKMMKKVGRAGKAGFMRGGLANLFGGGGAPPPGGGRFGR